MSDKLAFKRFGATVKGRLEGEWLALDAAEDWSPNGDKGYVLAFKDGIPLLQPFDATEHAPGFPLGREVKAQRLRLPPSSGNPEEQTSRAAETQEQAILSASEGAALCSLAAAALASEQQAAQDAPAESSHIGSKEKEEFTPQDAPAESSHIGSKEKEADGSGRNGEVRKKTKGSKKSPKQPHAVEEQRRGSPANPINKLILRGPGHASSCSSSTAASTPGERSPKPCLDNGWEGGNPKVFFEFTFNNEPSGRIEIELRADVCPNAAENFRCLCTGEKGQSPISSRRLHYKGSLIWRVVEDLIIQGGDFIHDNGTGGESIYGESFPDENFELTHSGRGVLSMDNHGPNTQNSRFLITLRRVQRLDGVNCVIGIVRKGMQVLDKIERLADMSSIVGKPKKLIKISDCGQL